MTIWELIEELKKYDKQTRVYYKDNEYWDMLVKYVYIEREHKEMDGEIYFKEKLIIGHYVN